MVRRIRGLKDGPAVPPVFGSEHAHPRTSIDVGDEVRCRKGHQEIYINILSVSADSRSLLGKVQSLGQPKGPKGVQVHVGDLVEFPTEKVLAVLHGDDSGTTEELMLDEESAPPRSRETA
jgi:hypothetical protein